MHGFCMPADEETFGICYHCYFKTAGKIAKRPINVTKPSELISTLKQREPVMDAAEIVDLSDTLSEEHDNIVDDVLIMAPPNTAVINVDNLFTPVLKEGYLEPPKPRVIT